MPWDQSDAKDKTKKANTLAKASAWADIANKARERTGSDASGIKIANAVIKRQGMKLGMKRRSGAGRGK